MLSDITDDLVRAVSRLSFKAPVHTVYNPLEYARPAWDEYCRMFGAAPREILILGLNPGPFGMAQTGVPFGEISAVRDWMGISAPIGRPPIEHPKRPVQGFDCERSEVSGRRLWGWAQTSFGSAATFFERFFVANYCPLVFMEDSGRNLTPDKLPTAERLPLYQACDQALRATVEYLRPRVVIGLGGVSSTRAAEALTGLSIDIVTAPHPSPANPAANRGWSALMDRTLASIVAKD